MVNPPGGAEQRFRAAAYNFGRHVRVDRQLANLYGPTPIHSMLLAGTNRQHGLRVVFDAFLTTAPVRLALTTWPSRITAALEFTRGVTRPTLSSIAGHVDRQIAHELQTAFSAGTPRWSLPSDDNVTTFEELHAGRALHGSGLVRLELIAAEVGRLLAPLTATRTADEPDPLVHRILADLIDLFKAGSAFEPWVVFDDEQHRHVVVSEDDFVARLVASTRRVWVEEKHAFFDVIEAGNDERDRTRARAAFEAQSRQAIAARYGVVEHAANAARASMGPRAVAGVAPPQPQPYGVSPAGAEQWVGEALRYLGVADATVTRQSGDGGVDVHSSRYAVSVKHYSGSVPVEEVREIFGVATSLGRQAMIWTSGTLTAAGNEFAERAPVLVVHYDVTSGTFEGATPFTIDRLRQGLD